MSEVKGWKSGWIGLGIVAAIGSVVTVAANAGVLPADIAVGINAILAVIAKFLKAPGQA